MQTVVVSQWNDAIDPVLFGERALRDVAGGAVIDGCGFGLPGVVLMRRAVQPTAGPWMAVGFSLELDSVQNMTCYPHAAEQGYEYVARHLAGNMQLDGEPGRPLRLDVDDEGELVTAGLPARPMSAAGEPTAEGAMVVSWRWTMHTRAASPAGFRVYAADDLDTPLTDARTGLDYVVFRGAGLHQAIIAGFSHEEATSFVVRAFGAAGEEAGEVATKLEAAIALGPSTPEAVFDVTPSSSTWAGYGGPS